MNINFSIIIPIYNEEESIFLLLEEIKKVFLNKNPEILIINDGSNDNFLIKFNKKKYSKNNVRVINHETNMGKCKAMLTGVEHAKYNLISVLDGDGQNPPFEIKNLINQWNKERRKSFLLVCGNRIKRRDTMLKKISSKFANLVRKSFLKDECNDTACALKIFQKNDYLKLPYFKNMHRFLPALFKMKKGKIVNVMVEDRVRLNGVSKFNFNNRFWVGIIDLLKVWLLINRRRKQL